MEQSVRCRGCTRLGSARSSLHLTAHLHVEGQVLTDDVRQAIDKVTDAEGHGRVTISQDFLETRCSQRNPQEESV